MPLFFAPLDNPRAPVPTTLEQERAAIGLWGYRARPGLAVEAETPERAADIALHYLRDCHASGRPGYAPTVRMKAPDSVPVFWETRPLPPLTAEETAAIDATIAIYAARHAKDKTDSTAPAGWGIIDTTPDTTPGDLDAPKDAPGDASSSAPPA
jgi:hypothetical protein